MKPMITTGARYVCLKRGDVYHYLAQKPTDMPEDVWDEISALLAQGLRSTLSRSSRARAILDRTPLRASVCEPDVMAEGERK